MFQESLHNLGVAPKTSERTLHLIDAENLGGTTYVAPAKAAALSLAYHSVAPSGSVNQLVVATSHAAARSYWFAWPSEARRLVRSGRDGADQELLAVLRGEGVPARFDRVVIGSGDGIFALPAAQLQSAGCAVTVVARKGALSRQLAFAVRDVRLLEERAIVSSLRMAS